MVAPEIDHNAIINRLIDVLQSDSNIWALDGSKIRSFTNGRPSAPLPPPYIAIYLVQEQDTRDGAATAGPNNYNVLNASKHVFAYELLLVSRLKTDEVTEQDIVNWIRLIKQDIKGNYDLKDPYIVGDPLVMTCHPTTTKFERGILPNTGEPGIAATLSLVMVQAT